MTGAWLGLFGVLVGALAVGVLTARREHSQWLRNQRLDAYLELVRATQELTLVYERWVHGTSLAETLDKAQDAARKAEAARVRIYLVGTVGTSNAAGELTRYIYSDVLRICEDLDPQDEAAAKLNFSDRPQFKKWEELEHNFVSSADDDVAVPSVWKTLVRLGG